MQSEIKTASATGIIEKAGAGGIGFRLVPAIDPLGPSTVRAGSFPVYVKVRNARGFAETLQVPNADALFIRAEGDEFATFDVYGSESGDQWCVQTFQHKYEGIIPSGQKTRIARLVQDATAVPTAAPSADPTVPDGIKVRPGTLGHTFYFAGTARTVSIWQRGKSGLYTNSLATIVTSEEAVAWRSNLSGADRIYLQADGASCTVAIDATEEVG